MIKMHYIKSFIFDKAQYRISDGNGSMGVLKIDYYHKTFEIKGKNISPQIALEASKLAQDLLDHKHAVNFAKY